MISTYFSIQTLSDVFFVFCLLCWSPSCLKSSGRLLGSISTKSRPNPTGLHQGNYDFLLKNCGVNQSDLDWWKLIPGVSRSFSNSSGTKITAQSTKKHEIQVFKKNTNSNKNQIYRFQTCRAVYICSFS